MDGAPQSDLSCPEWLTYTGVEDADGVADGDGDGDGDGETALVALVVGDADADGDGDAEVEGDAELACSLRLDSPHDGRSSGPSVAASDAPGPSPAPTPDPDHGAVWDAEGLPCMVKALPSAGSRWVRGPCNATSVAATVTAWARLRPSLDASVRAREAATASREEPWLARPALISVQDCTEKDTW